ncbi:GntR family transcriptional regulator [Nocardia sp. NPDC051321]|uniref:GntR family transcriptional regulator n=1 Tax=Nocardia sp. NPDC051321 TaxID=3364323 RepID=UPI0037BB324B
MKVSNDAVNSGAEQAGTDRRAAASTRPASSTTAKVLDAIRGAIVNGELSPGEQLRQQAWAERCGVSRPPVREALEILSNEGLLTHGLNQGYFVAKFSNDEVEQLYTMRDLLEAEALRTLEWPSPEVLAELSAHVDRIEAEAMAGRPDLARGAMADLYLSIYRLCHRTLIIAEIERLWARTASYRAHNYDILAAPQESTVQFRLILDALAAQDRERLTERLQRPVVTILSRARSAISRAATSDS